MLIAQQEDIDWFQRELRKSDCADVKSFYLQSSSDTQDGILPSCGAPWSLSAALRPSRLVACDERTLWECLGPNFTATFANPIDSWNEQLAVKVVYNFLLHVMADSSNARDHASLMAELVAYTAEHIQPKAHSAPLSTHKACESSTATSATTFQASVKVAPMEEGNDYSEGSLVCSEDVDAFGVVLRVPRAFMFYRDSVLMHSELGRAIRRESQLSSIYDNEEALLVMCFVYELYVVGADRSHWRELLLRCPRSYPTVPAFWDVVELYELSGLDVLDDILAKKSQLDEFCAQVRGALPILFRAMTTKPDGLTLEAFEAAFSVDNVRVARATFDSRAFKLNVDGAVVLSLVPLADMINHCNTGSDVLLRRVEEDGGDFVMQIGAPLTARDAGREVWMSYGPLQNWELLQFYGFVMDHNEHDKLPFPLFVDGDPAADDVWGRRRLDIINMYSLFSVQRCWLASSGVPCEALKALLRLHLAQGEEFDAMEVNGPFAPLSAETEAAVVETIRQTVLGVREQCGFPTGQEEEEEEEADDNNDASDHDEEGDDDPYSNINYELCRRLRAGLDGIAGRSLAWCDTQ